MMYVFLCVHNAVRSFPNAICISFFNEVEKMVFIKKMQEREKQSKIFEVWGYKL